MVDVPEPPQAAPPTFERPSSGDAVTSTQAAYHQIRERIVEGIYGPGERLVEQRLATELNLSSRTPVREALRMLESDGLIQNIPNRGAEVRSLTVDEISDMYELRARLESYAAELSATRATAPELDRLAAAVEHFDNIVRAGIASEIEQLRHLNAANRTIHDTILRSSGHERLVQLRVRVVDLPLVFEAFRRFDETELSQSSTFHRLIYEAIAANDGARAARLMTEHILQGRDVLLGRLATTAGLTATADQTASAPAGERPGLRELAGHVMPERHLQIADNAE